MHCCKTFIMGRVKPEFTEKEILVVNKIKEALKGYSFEDSRTIFYKIEVLLANEFII